MTLNAFAFVVELAWANYLTWVQACGTTSSGKNGEVINKIKTGKLPWELLVLVSEWFV